MKPAKVLSWTELTDVKIKCKAFAVPPPKVTWSRGLLPLRSNRIKLLNGTLHIKRVQWAADTGPYVCNAENQLGKVSTVTTLQVQSTGKVISKPPKNS